MRRHSGSHCPGVGARPCGDERTSESIGALSWFMERVTCDPQSPPFASQARRICHAANHLTRCADDTERSSDADGRDDIVQWTSAAVIADVWVSRMARHQTPDSTTDVDVDPAGRSSYLLVIEIG